ncbi:hypothetical protein NDU88_010658 [Pleurodeles waltl]|uniref:Uncharacterized protein n=1 Tax=Pleurodeles waltl TaxID=8319 RepID=A0AAV7QV16_PLEWA|nr:hypothetical protein NDU88_010658 [Pleurodeles waltl]
MCRSRPGGKDLDIGRDVVRIGGYNKHGAVLAGANLARSPRRTPGLSLAAREHGSGRSGCGEARAGLLTASSARAGCRAGGRGGPWLFPEVCGRVRCYDWGPLGDLVGSRPRGALGFCGAAIEEALLDPAVHLRPGSSAG